MASSAHVPPPRVTPLAPERYALQLTMTQAMHDKLRHAQSLLRHTIPSGDVARVLERALDALIPVLEKRKFGAAAAAAPRAQGRPARGRTIPARIRREVRARDAGRCSFLADSGQRCEARDFLEFDHVVPLAKGGRTTAENLRLLCRTHNQLEAERALGEGFMHAARERARGTGT